ncbi:hypothetical protein BS47DRAFT_1345500 [Hydnum rufescens UP504]|uniref:Uncharacterized protein n=1 Tax=Hydnum rufescens UP504 TaxID=1448309 RepID=A0A9P6AUU2_9AGAM|nr:hypothetical protein BS47DRAFT_1345500 [Hydnum rufescens UP504]
MLHSLVSAQPPGHVVHICTQLPEPKAGPQQKFISGSEKDFRIMGMTKTPYPFIARHIGSDAECFCTISIRERACIMEMSQGTLSASWAKGMTQCPM